MKKFCVISNRGKGETQEVAGYIVRYLEQREAECFVLENQKDVRDGVRHFTRTEEISEMTECALVLGGDGTMIQAAIDLVHQNIPILGINMGTMGFLTEVERQHMDQALDRLLAADYTIENRIMLTAARWSGDQGQGAAGPIYALNDVVVSKRGSCRLITIEVYINEELADIYRADGLIVSTPTGSTGYNLSAGGPVMVPHAHATVITPVCPHSLNKRSLVVSAADRIRLQIGRTKEALEDTAVLMVDGRNTGELVTGDVLDIRVPEEMTQLVKLSDRSFYKRMRDKLNGN